MRELSFPIFFLKFLNGENSGGMQSKRIYIYKCFLSHWIQILANSSPKSDIFKTKKTKKKRPCFFTFYGRSGEGNIKKKKLGLAKEGLFKTSTCTCSLLSHQPSKKKIKLLEKTISLVAFLQVFVIICIIKKKWKVKIKILSFCRVSSYSLGDTE